MSLHRARLSLMATERACSLLTSNQMSLHQAILLWPSQSLHSSDQMSLHQARLSVMATQRACTFLTKCCSIRPFCLSRPFKELVHFWNVISLLLSYATWVVRGGRNLQFSRYIPTYCSIWWFIHIIIFPVWSWDSLLVRARDSQSKGCEFESQQEQQENFLLQSQLCVLTHIRCPCHPCITTVAHKRPQSFCQKCKWQVTPETHIDPWPNEVGVGWLPLSGHNVGTYPETSSHATCQGTLGHSRLRSLSHCGLILA